MPKTILFLVPNHALGHTVETISLANDLRHLQGLNLLFLVEQRADLYFRDYGFNTISFPARDMYSASTHHHLFDSYIEDAATSLIKAISPDLVVTNNPGFVFSAGEICRDLHLPHISLYGQFSEWRLQHLSEVSAAVICTVPEKFAFFRADNIHYTGPMMINQELSAEEQQQYSAIINRPFILISMGGGAWEAETQLMLQAIVTAIAGMSDYHFVIVGKVNAIPFKHAQVTYLGAVPPHIMSFLEKRCLLGIARAGKTLVELSACRKPFLALPLPGISEQLRRSKLIAEAGGAELIEYGLLTAERIRERLELLLSNYDEYLDALTQLEIKLGNDLACSLILNQLANTKRVSTHDTARYPFPHGSLDVKQTDEHIYITATYHVSPDSPVFEFSSSDAAPVPVKVFVPDWLVAHSPFFLRKALQLPEYIRSIPEGHIVVDSFKIEVEKGKISWKGKISEIPIEGVMTATSTSQTVSLMLNKHRE